MIFKRRGDEHQTRIFFTSDVHGSERTFRKFLSAGKFYKANVVMLCGDLTGKLLVPILRKSDGTWMTSLFGREEIIKTQEELKKIEESVLTMGGYIYHMEKEESEEFKANEKKRDAIFKRLMLERLERWMKLAEESYRNSDIKCIMSPGNDDLPEIDEVLNSSDYIVNPDNKKIWIDDYHEMITLSCANVTPWNCPRDVSEEELNEMINKLIPQLEDVKNSIFNFHAPPINSTLDTAFKLDTSVSPPKIVTKMGRPVTIGVGSHAVRESIEKYQPLLGLHGHIHESRGFIKIGRTLCVNPGSEYGEGILRGVLINITKDKVLSYQLTSG